jgi:hypothetical protein
MNGTKGFRTREAAAFRKNRSHRLTSEEVRAARFANLHGNAEAPVVAAEPVEPVVDVVGTEVIADAPADETIVADEAGDQTGDEAGEGAGDEAGDEAADEAGDETGDEAGDEDSDEDEAEADAGADKSKKTAAKKKAKAKAKAK